MSMGKKITFEEFLERANQVHNGKYDYDKSLFVNTQTKVCIVCHEIDENGNEHGEFWQTPNKHMAGRGCPKCAQLSRIEKMTRTQEEFERKANLVHNNKYTYCGDYKNGTTKIRIICPVHGEFMQIPQHHLCGEGCPRCAIEKNTKRQQMTLTEFVEKANLIHNFKYDYSESIYVNYKTPLKIICNIIDKNGKEHGEFWQTPDCHLHYHGCPKCGNQLSNAEDEIREFIENELNLDVISRDKKIIPPYELDLYVKGKKVAIEYDGLIWHSEKFGKDRNYHLNKTIQCEKQGIRLIHVFENEWLEKENIVKSKIKHILGHDYDLIKVFARKCSVKEINYLEAREFLDKNHIQGSCNSTIYLGCYYNNELIGVMSFRREIKESNSWELTRFATDINKQCIGVGGKMFKYFIEKYNPSYIKSFADRRWSTGDNNLYVKLGFKLDKILRPDYKYVVGDKCIHKFNFRKQILLKRYPNYGLTNDMSEYEMTQKLGFYRIWDCGLYKFVWKI